MFKKILLLKFLLVVVIFSTLSQIHLLLLHHIFTAGTEKQFVYEDYYLQLYKGTVACAQLSSTLLAEILSASSDSTPTLYVVSLCVEVFKLSQACCIMPTFLMLTFCTSAMCV